MLLNFFYEFTFNLSESSMTGWSDILGDRTNHCSVVHIYCMLRDHIEIAHIFSIALDSIILDWTSSAYVVGNSY